MIISLINLLVIALVLLVIWYIVGMFIQGRIHQVVGLILGLILLVAALKIFNVVTL